MALPVTSTKLVIPALTALMFLGCVERKEHLKISPDGGVDWHVTHEADSLDELYEGDAVPRLAGGWLVEQQTIEPNSQQAADNRRQDGEPPPVKHLLIADAVFPPGHKLPSSYALPAEVDGHLYLQFPTVVTIEERADGRYFHFARTYQSRPWAQIELLRVALVDEPMRELEGVEPRSWTPQQRIAALQAQASFDTEKALVFARTAFKRTTPSPDHPQDAWLAVRHHMLDCAAMLDYAELAKLLEPRETAVEEEARGQAIAVEIARFEQMQRDQLKEALRTHAAYTGSQVQKFLDEFERQKRGYQISEDLGDDQFTIEVQMPGEIVASNADSVAGSTAAWQLNGQMFRDREVELLVTSRMAR